MRHLFVVTRRSFASSYRVLRSPQAESSTVDVERIRHFFGDSKVSAITGQFTEQIVADLLVDAGFTSFPIPYKVLPRVKMELSNRLWTESKDLIFGELDALVSGPTSAVENLISTCPTHCINDDQLCAPAPFKIVVLEVKSTVVTLLSTLKEFKDKGRKQNLKDDAPSLWWLLQTLPEPLHKVLFLNGGQRSKNFILNGGNSTNTDESEAWHELRKAKVSIFYKQSFTLEWTTDLSNAVEAQASEIKTQASEIKTLQAAVKRLLDEKKP